MLLRTILCLSLCAVLLPAEEDPQEPPQKPAAPALDLKKILSESDEFQAKLKSFGMSYEEGLVRAIGEVAYRGGGPCEYLVNVYPAKAHETVVLLDNGPWKGEGRRPRRFSKGLAITLNNAFICAGFKTGKVFSWDNKTGEVFPPKGPTVYLYAEWTDEAGKKHRALMSEWLWNFKTQYVMKPGKFVYTGSQMIDEGPPHHKKWFGAEVDGLLVAIMNTSTSLIDNTEEGGEENGAYEAIPLRVPPIGTRVTILFSDKKLDGALVHKPLRLPKEVFEARKRIAAEKAAAEKAAAEKAKAAAAKEKGTTGDK